MKVKLESWAIMPTRAHPTDAGMDLYCPYDVTITGHSSEVIDTGVHIQLPSGTVGMIKSKSGLNVKRNLVTEGVIDEGYTGSVVVKMYNHGCLPYKISKGDKLTQLVVMPVEYVSIDVVDSLEETERGENGFGSTGL